MIPPLSAWGLSGTPAPLPGGHRNTVLRLHDHVLKTTRRSEAAIAWLLPVMDRAQPCGLTTPRPIRSTRGPFVCDGWTCEPFFPGVPAAVAPFADRLEMFHNTCRDVPQRPGFASARDLLDADAGGDVDLSGMPERLVTAIRAAWQDVS
ncbi:MAG: aminoglycoside phosphotransferase, partial [Pseudomonadota bacterium]